MANVRVVPRSLTQSYNKREGDFAPNLVGRQFTDGSSLFTFGTFQITTNLTSPITTNFTLGGQWSDYYNLENLNLTQTESNILQSNELTIKLNFNPFNISRYVYFGSFYELLRVSIEEIIQSWKGSLYLNPLVNSNVPVNTVLSFSYNAQNDTSQFLIPKSIAENKFQLIVDDNIDFSNIPEGEIYNLSKSYDSYVIWNRELNQEFPVIGYTGSSADYNYIVVETEGNPFPSLTASTFGQINYHLKPNAVEVQLFFEQLSEIKSLLVDRLTNPAYKFTVDVPKEYEGRVYISTKSFIWPVSDGYNLDIDSGNYRNYIESILESAIDYDKYKTDLMSRRFVSESIHEFDTNGGTVTSEGDDIYGMKVSKLLRIYGREYDEVKKYIDGISFANVVTYDKLDNTSDELIKVIAKNLGFDTILTVTTDNFNLLEQITPSLQTPFEGYSRSLSAKELDIELWRRIVINAWWLYKAKGTRKVLEFFLNLFKIPECMISLDEYIYLAENRLNTNEVHQTLNQLYNITSPTTGTTGTTGTTTGTVQINPIGQIVTNFQVIDLFGNTFNTSELPMDEFGFPKLLPNTEGYYFQNNGFWYNGGNITTDGNNPHIGPYDFGQSYFDPYKCFVPNFSSLLSSTTFVTVVENYFTEFNTGNFGTQNYLPVPYYGQAYANVLNTYDGNNAVINLAGLVVNNGVDDQNSMQINFTPGDINSCPICDYNFYYCPDGIIYTDSLCTTPLTEQICCDGYFGPLEPSLPSTCPPKSSLLINSPSGFDPDRTIIYQTTDINGQLIYPRLPKECCTEEITGINYVTWDDTKNKCLYTTVDTGGRFSNQNMVKTYNTNDLFPPPTVLSETNPVTSVCYWCPPKNSVVKICNIDEYIDLFTQSELIDFAIELGATPSITYSAAATFILNIFNNSGFFNQYCFLTDGVNVINNNLCCKNNGGNLLPIGNPPTNYCVVPNTIPCTSATNDNYVWYASLNPQVLLSQACCVGDGHFWIPAYSRPTTITPQPFTNIVLELSNGGYFNFIDPFTPISPTNNQPSSFCSTCPPKLKEVTLNNLLVIEYLTNSGSSPLLQSCCTRYGFTWNGSVCLSCPKEVNNNGQFITNTDGSQLSEQCCKRVGGWYGSEFSNSNEVKCYVCPPLNIDGQPNTGYSISNSQVYYDGVPLSRICCENYSRVDNNVVWDGTYCIRR